MSYNPWGKKNPFLSMWLSGANAMLGLSRNYPTATSRRQTNDAVREGSKQILASWGIGDPVKKRLVKRRRR